MTDPAIMRELWEVIDDRFTHPREGSYIRRLVEDPKGIDRLLEKVGEEASEFIIASKNGRRDQIIAEAADLLFHLLLALRASGLDLEDLLAELAERRR